MNNNIHVITFVTLYLNKYWKGIKRDIKRGERQSQPKHKDISFLDRNRHDSSLLLPVFLCRCNVFYFIPTDRQRRCFSTGCSISRMRRSSNYTKKVTCDTWVTRESLYIPESPEVLFLLFSRGSVLAGHTNIVCCKRYHISLSQVAL